MRHQVFSEPKDSYPIAILCKASAFSNQDMLDSYVEPLGKLGVAADQLIAFTLAYNEHGKAPASYVKTYLDGLLKALQSLSVTYLYVTDANYFKTLTGAKKAALHLGYVLPCKIKGYEHMQVILGLNYNQLIYDPTLQESLDLSLKTLATAIQGTYQAIGSNIIHSEYYPTKTYAIAAALDSLHQYPQLTCDIETFSLRFNEAGIGTIAFAWNQHEGVAFQVDYLPVPKREDGTYGIQIGNVPVRLLLRDFFEAYQGELIFHNASFDVKNLIYSLWMDDLLDQEGLLKGLDILGPKLHDTMLIAYLATNSTAGNKLSLKDLAHEYAGNWAVEVKDISKQPLDTLLQYNLVDCLSTWYVYSKYLPIMESDQQGELYRGLFLDSLRLIIQMELTGMPMSRKRIQEVKAELQAHVQNQEDVIHSSSVVDELETLLQTTAWKDDFEARHSKAKHPDKIKWKERSAFDDIRFNPNSGPQMQRLLYEVMGLPIIDYTDTKQPATGAETIEKLVNHTSIPEHKEVLSALLEYGKAQKILSTFIPAFEQGISKDDSDTIWLHGSFMLGGTVSGRLSSNSPNMQNLPANSHYGKLIKSCFIAPEDWLFCGADFHSLEDYVSALTTRDPNKLAVYTKGFDGHCFRAAYYYRDQLMHINLDDPVSVNSIAKTHKHLRQESKTPTFALTYAGTYHTLMNNLGWSMEKAKYVEASYHEMYKVSDQYVQSRLKQANKDGFVVVAFGLRVRTPLLKQVVWGSRLPNEAASEARTAGNALGQSYGLLNNRAAVSFFKKVWESPYRNSILPVALIHDAIYVLIKNDVGIVEWANNNLIKEMQWQELPELHHDTVKLGAELDIYWPSWEVSTTLPNNINQQEIKNLCLETKAKVTS